MSPTVRTTRPRWQVHLQPTHVGGQAHNRTEAAGRPREAAFLHTDGWSVLHAPAGPDMDPLDGQLGRPGLWRLVGDPLARVFELPGLTELEKDSELEEENPIVECQAWALCTAAGKLPDGWQPPPRDEVESWIPAGALTLRAEAQVRQIALVCEPHRLALTCPIVTNIGPHLSAARRNWLRALLKDGQDRWRLVRLGLTETAALAEVDLSGVPPMMAERLFRTGLGALRWVVGWLVESAAFLADGANPCQAVEVCPMRDRPRKGG